MGDTAQQQWKQRSLSQVMQRIARIEGSVPPLKCGSPPLAYRNRAVIPLERTADGHLRAGYYRRGSHRIVNMSRCPVLDPRIDALIAPLKQDLERSDWAVDRHGGGGLRHLALRIGSRSGEILITLVSADDALPDLEILAEHWLDRWPAVVGVSLNLQPQPTNVLMGPENRVIRGRGWLRESFAGLDFRIATDTFFQVNSAAAEQVVPLLLQGLVGTSGTVLDAFCGLGTFSLPLAAAGWRVHGIEQHAAAVELARHNAADNRLSDLASFEQADVGAVLAERLNQIEATALLLDPPRKGLERSCLEAIRTARPGRLLYLSCDPATLARDLQQLVGEGEYDVVSLQPFDFFPNTSHIETLAVLQLRS
jgi:23S rRNA (uracil1939-C5)-methyltransferase